MKNEIVVKKGGRNKDIYIYYNFSRVVLLKNCIAFYSFLYNFVALLCETCNATS